MNLSLSFIINGFCLELNLKKYEITIPSKKREEEFKKIQNDKDSDDIKAIFDLNFFPIDDETIILYGLLSSELDASIKNIENIPKKFSSKVIIKKIANIYQTNCDEFAPPLYQKKKKRNSRNIETLEDLLEEDSFKEEKEKEKVKKTRKSIPKVLSVSFLPFYFHELSTKKYGKNINTISLFYELLFSYQNVYITDMDKNLLNNIKLQFQTLHNNIYFLTNIYKEMALKYSITKIRKQKINLESKQKRIKRKREGNDEQVLKKRKIK